MKIARIISSACFILIGSFFVGLLVKEFANDILAFALLIAAMMLAIAGIAWEIAHGHVFTPNSRSRRNH